MAWKKYRTKKAAHGIETQAGGQANGRGLCHPAAIASAPAVRKTAGYAKPAAASAKDGAERGRAHQESDRRLALG
jgi:hypothetical protein